MFKWLKQLICKHDEAVFVSNIYGDEINHMDGKRSRWICDCCGKILLKNHLLLFDKSKCRFAIGELIFTTSRTYIKAGAYKMPFSYYPVVYMIKDVRKKENSIEYLCEDYEDKSKRWIKEEFLTKALCWESIE
jgi:hypothetical protein|nr:MAG TPA: adenylate kinase [Caudoviricetes sp.]